MRVQATTTYDWTQERTITEFELTDGPGFELMSNDGTITAVVLKHEAWLPPDDLDGPQLLWWETTFERLDGEDQA